MFWAARFLLYSRRDFYLSSIPWFIKHWTPTSLRIPSLDPPLGEKPSALPPFLWITGASPFHSVSDGIPWTQRLSTVHRHGFSVFSFRAVPQYWATLREPLHDLSSFPKTRLSFGLVLFLTSLPSFHRLMFCAVVFQGDHSYKQSKDTEERLKVIPKFCFPDSKNWVPTSELKR